MLGVERISRKKNSVYKEPHRKRKWVHIWNLPLPLPTILLLRKLPACPTYGPAGSSRIIF